LNSPADQISFYAFESPFVLNGSTGPPNIAEIFFSHKSDSRIKD